MSVVIGLGVTARLAHPVIMPQDWTHLVMGVGSEMLIGASIGFAVSLLFTGVELAAEQIAQQMGIALGSVFNPLLEDSTNVLGVLFHMTALAIFLVVGGHRLMMAGVLDSFQRVPLLSFAGTQNLLDMVIALLTAAFMMSIKLSAPTVLAIFLATLAMVFVQRTMPQLNILSAGFQVRVMLAMMIMVASLMVMPVLLDAGWRITMEQLAKVF